MKNLKLLQLLESILGKGKPTSGNNIAFFSPFQSHYKPKLEIDINTTSAGENAWHCWISDKKGRSIASLFKQLNLPKERFEQLNRIVESARYRTDNKETKTNQTIQLPEEYSPLWIKKSTPDYRNAIHYLSKRGVTIFDILKYRIGYCESGEYSKKIIIPSYDETGRLNYFVGRAYYEAESFKHKNPDTSKNCVGFELFINWTLPIVLVEGSFDAIAVRRNSIPLFGKTISEDLRKKIIENKVTKLYICLDKDAQKQALEHAEYFMNNGVEVYFVDLQEKDPAEIGFERMCTLIKETPALTFTQFMKYKLFA